MTTRGSSPSCSRISPTISPTAKAASGCVDIDVAANTETSSDCSGGRIDRERHHRNRPLIDTAVSLDGSGLVPRQLGLYQPVVELARIDLKGLDVACDLSFVAHELDLERAEAAMIGRAANEHN